MYIVACLYKGGGYLIRYGITNEPIVTIWAGPNETKEGDMGILSSIADESLYGMGLTITGKLKEGFWPVRTFYGYEGYVKEDQIRIVGLAELQEWEECDLMVTAGFCVDVTSLPSVQGVRLMSLYKGSILDVVEYETEEKGWARVYLPDGRTGYLRNQYLCKKEFSQAGLWTGEPVQKKIVDEAAFRKAVTATAMEYLGIQYRWGGRSTAGLDCSGLTSESYMLNGILTYRDADIVEGFPVHEISKDEMLPGDLMYFPGHIAMYLGEGKYIHSTGKIGSGGVVINSMNPADENYREDLVKSFYAVGSIF